MCFNSFQGGKILVDPKIVIATVFALYGIGMLCLATRRDLIRLLIALTLMMNAANLSFVLFSTVKIPGLIDPLPHALVVMAIVIDGCVIMIGLILTVLIYHKYGSLDIEKLRRLKW